MGLARVDLTPAGLRHGLFSSLPANFDVSESHDDEVHAEPPRNAAVDSQVLAGNRHSMVQAIDVRAGPGRFWAIQWHPEYSLADLAALTHARADKLVSQGFYTDRAQVMRRTRAFYELDAEPGRKDLETRLGLRSEGMGEAARYALCGNWVRKQVVPFYAKRLHGVAQGVEEGERLKESRG
jgi:GMP synthase (glutamine-hydrolysing)